MKSLQEEIATMIECSDIRRADGKQRWYSDGKGPWVPSVTTILGVLDKGIGFEKWLGNSVSYDAACEYRDLRASIGTMVHDHAEAYNKGLKVEIDPNDEEMAKYMMSYEAWYKDYYLKDMIVEACELKLYHKDIPFSGTLDMAITVNLLNKQNKLCLVDIKTGDYRKSHGLQLTAYAMLWNACFPNYPVDSLYGLYLKSGWRKEANYGLKELKFEPEVVHKVCDLWTWSNTSARGVKPGPKPAKVYDYSFQREDVLVNEDTL